MAYSSARSTTRATWKPIQYEVGVKPAKILSCASALIDQMYEIQEEVG
jgi:hypothetical protein